MPACCSAAPRGTLVTLDNVVPSIPATKNCYIGIWAQPPPPLLAVLQCRLVSGRACHRRSRVRLAKRSEVGWAGTVHLRACLMVGSVVAELLRRRVGGRFAMCTLQAKDAWTEENRIEENVRQSFRRRTFGPTAACAGAYLNLCSNFQFPRCLLGVLGSCTSFRTADGGHAGEHPLSAVCLLLRHRGRMRSSKSNRSSSASSH